MSRIYMFFIRVSFVVGITRVFVCAKHYEFEIGANKSIM